MQSAEDNDIGLTVKRLPLIEFIVLMALLTSLVALSIDAVLPALDRIGADVNSESAQQNYLIVSLFFAGMSIGQLFFGPFSDARGRRLTILIGLIIFLIGTLICYFASTIETLLIGRVVQAFGLSGPRIATMALIRDLYVGDGMARVMSFITVMFITVPMIAPLIGQWVMNWYGWREIFVLFGIVAILSGIWFFSRQGETLPRAHRVRFSPKVFVRSIWWLVKHPVVMGASIGMGCIFGAFLAYLSSSQTIFQSIYNAGEWFPLLFAALAFSIGAASLFNGFMVMRLGMVKLVTWATSFSILYSLVLTGLVFTYDGVPPLFAFMLVMFCGFFFIGVLFGNLNSLAMEPVGHIAGVGAAFVGSFSSLIAVPISVSIGSFLTTSLLPIAIGFLVFSVLTFFAVLMATIQKRKTDAGGL